MSLVQSNMMELGTKAPSFSLPDTISGNVLSLSEVKSDIATVIAFICNHCPFVHHINNKFVEIANEFQAKGVEFIAISSNDVNYYPQDGPEMMKKVAKSTGYNFPYLYDENQEVAKAYQAECTPDFFVFNRNLTLAYRGRFDETRPGMGTATGNDLSAALTALVNNSEITLDQKPSIGCSIKWK
ncbi:thioredoxin family protein [Aquimarina litoralis]|uniref:thioredoxin family protein n=1 Tax=Aquimarina litoralis TaxID=584605 RepID=UPI001C589241|nr:thioredoxin family protein [Aquimarina litoralis]MBW1296219.1 redoxin domain-containing protein [Aquimarina litoralis]